MSQSAAKAPVRFDYARFAQQGDMMLAGGVVIILMIMLIPMPTIVLDVMLTFSIAISLVILVTSMFMNSPLEFSIFPSLLLVTTLLRLALNVASTRLILLHGDEGVSAAGHVIEAFGQFVVGGNYAVGVIIFLILFALNKMVITSGTTRIAEVAARFTLDAMPGKQMAIEADLNAGLIDEEEANHRRTAIRKEADFYGAMDGAGKFVSGDVKAGILITFINIIGGFFIGVFQKKMNWADAASIYTILTIGDGLVSIIPSIITSTAAGIIVSRAAAEARMGEEFLAQLTFHPKALKLVSGILGLISLVPGMPLIPFLALAGGTFALSRVAGGSVEDAKKSAGGGAGAGGKTGGKGGGGQAATPGQAQPLDSPEEVQTLLPLDVLELEVGYGLIPLVDEEQSGNLLARIRSIRRQFALDMGVIVPSLHLRDNLQLKPGQYNLLVKGNLAAGAEILIDHLLAMDPGDARLRLQGVETREPAFNLPAIWIPESRKEEAMLAGYTVVDPATVIATHLTEIFRRNLHEFLGRQEVQALLDNLAKRAPKAVEDLTPGTLPLGVVQKVLQNLVRERVSIRDLLTVVEALADFGPGVKDSEQLTEFVRGRLARTVVKPYLSADNVLPIITLDSGLDRMVSESVRHAEQGAYLAMEPSQAQRLIQNLNQALDSAVVADGQPVLLVSPLVRPHLAQLLARFAPNLPVVSQAEIPPDIRLQSVASVKA